MCGTGGFQEQGQCFFIGLSCSFSTILFYSLSLSFFLSIGWNFGAGVFGLIGCTSLSPSLALQTFFNNNNRKSEQSDIDDSYVKIIKRIVNLSQNTNSFHMARIMARIILEPLTSLFPQLGYKINLVYIRI